MKNYLLSVFLLLFVLPLDGFAKQTKKQSSIIPQNNAQQSETVVAKMTMLAKTPHVQAAVAVRAHGKIKVKVIIDEKGEVVFAEAHSGHALLKYAARSSAYRSKFIPSLINGKAVKTKGNLIYVFSTDSSSQISIGKFTAAPGLTDEAVRYLRIQGKLNDKVWKLVKRIQGGKTNLDDFEFVKNGQAHIIVTSLLADDNGGKKTIEELSKLGFKDVVKLSSGKWAGYVALEKIPILAEAWSTYYIEPFHE